MSHQRISSGRCGGRLLRIVDILIIDVAKQSCIVLQVAMLNCQKVAVGSEIAGAIMKSVGLWDPKSNLFVTAAAPFLKYYPAGISRSLGVLCLMPTRHSPLATGLEILLLSPFFRKLLITCIVVTTTSSVPCPVTRGLNLAVIHQMTS
jgi:hypothetical protein